MRADVRAVATVLIVIGLVACGSSQDFSNAVGSTTPATAQRTPRVKTSGYDDVSIKNPTLHLSVPHTWTTFDLTKDRIDDIRRILAANNPKLAKSLSDSVAGSIAKGGRFFAVAKNQHEGFASNVNVIAGRGDLGGLSPQDLSDRLESSTGMTVTDAHSVKVNGASGMRIAYDLPLNTLTQDLKVAGIQVYLEVDGYVAVVTISVNPVDKAAANRIADSVSP